MSLDDNSPAAVRIELSIDGDLAAPPPLEPEGSRGGRNTVVAILVATLLVAGLLYATRPAEGETAAGTPISGPPTTVERGSAETNADELTGSTSQSPDSSSEEGTSEDGSVSDSPTEPAQIDSVDFDIFMFSVVRADVGWLGLGFSGNTPGLWRSVNGLNWTALPADTLPAGDLVGFDRIDGVYVVAIDEEQSWSENGFNLDEGEFPRHRISVWQSSDAVNWFATERPVLEGIGFPYPASFSRDSYVVPMVEPNNSDETLVRFLEPFVDDATAMRVCSMRRDFSESTMIVILEDCAGDVVAEIRETAFPDDFDRLTRDYCLEQALSIDAQRTLSVVVRNDEPAQKVVLDDTFGLFGRALPNGFVTQTGFSISGTVSSECGGDVEREPQTNGVLYWTDEVGQIDVTPPHRGDDANEPWVASPQGRLSLIDGDEGARLRVANDEGIWEGEPPFDSWQLVAAPPELEQALQGERPPTISLSQDGSAALVQTRERLHLWTSGEWSVIDFTELDSVELLVSNDEIVIVSGQSSRGPRLTRIWLQS